MDFREAERRIAEAGQELRALDAEFSRVAASEKLLAAHAAQLKERLQGVRVKATAQQAARRYAGRHGGLGREGDFRSGRRPFGGVPQCGLPQIGPHARGRNAREAQEPLVRACLRTGGRHVRPPEIRDDGPHALLRSVLHALFRHLSQRCRLRTDPDPDGVVDARQEPKARHDASGGVVRHVVRRVDRRVRTAVRLVLRHQHEHVVPLGEIPRFPGTVLLHRAGYRRGADSFRHAAQHLDDRSLFRFRPCAGTAGVVHHPRLVLSGHGPSDGGSRHSRALRPDRWPSMRRWASAAC